MIGHCLVQLLEWAPHEIANLPGVIALLAGITMWVTSFGWVRQKYFELFFYTHQLYIVFVVFMAFHVGDFIFNIAFSGLFLFSIDRFLRFCQSRNSVGIISTKLMPCGTYELVIAKPPGTPFIPLLNGTFVYWFLLYDVFSSIRAMEINPLPFKINPTLVIYANDANLRHYIWTTTHVMSHLAYSIHFQDNVSTFPGGRKM